MPAETELWDLIASRREGVLGTIKRSGLDRVYGVITSAGLRPLPAPAGAPSLPGPRVPLAP